MKLLWCVLLIALAVNGVFTLPARNSPQDDAEVISVPQRRPEASDLDFNDFKGVVDTAFLQPRPSIFNFNLGLSNSFDDIFRRLRGRIWPIAVDSDESGTGGSDDSDETAGTFGLALRPLQPLDPKNGNTTSTVKVVDGHKVEINETTYGDANSLFKVRVVNVRPLESGEEVIEGVTNNHGDFKPVSSPSTESPPKRSELDESKEEEEDDRREPLEKQPKDNEVRDIDEPQTQRTTSTTTTPTTTTTKATTAKSTLASSSSLEAIAEDSLADSTDIRHTIMADLIEDVLQQQEKEEEQQQQQQQEKEEQQQQEQLAAAQDAGTMAHNEETEMPLPDSDSHNAADEQQAPESLAAIENFGDESQSESESELEDQQLEQMQMQLQLQQMQREREELESSDDEDVNAAPVEMSDTFNDEWSEHADPSNDLNNHIDIYENFVPVDLSNDIAVNDVAAANPDFPYNPDAELIEVPAAVPTMPKFEKLSLMPPTTLMK